MRSVLKIFALAFLVFNAVESFSENVTDNPGKIRGTVYDASTKEALEYATVAVYKQSDSALVSGTVTDLLGHFRLDDLVPGHYYLVVSFIGMQDQRIDNVLVREGSENLNLGKIILNPLSNELKEVEVVSKRVPVDYQIDKKVVNVDRQITAAGGSAVDVLENVPSIKVDVDGNVTLRGSSGFTVLMDGKPTVLEPSDALRQVPASSIQNIEIITNPSVKYKPDGSAGIINIITKKNHLDGFSGLVNLNAGMYDTYGGDILLSYRLNKFNFILGGNYNRRSRPGTSQSIRETYEFDSIFYVSSDGDRDRGGVNSGVKAGIEFDATKKDFFSLGGTFGSWNMKGTSQLLYSEWTFPESYFYQYNSVEESSRGGTYYEISGAYQHKFEKKGHLIDFSAIYQNRNGDEFSQSELSDLDGTLNNGKKNVEKGPTKDWVLRLDYTQPVREEDKFEAGTEIRLGQSTDITELYFLDTENGEFIEQPEFGHTTNYTRNIYGVYALYAGEIQKFGYQVGLRGEYTDQVVATSGEPDYIQDRWDYFPSIHLSFELPKENQVMASYTRRIERPGGWELEPFITWQDEFNVRQGNPELLPEFIDSFDASFLMKLKKGTFSIDAYYRITNNKVEHVQSIFFEDVLMNTVENVGKDYSLGTELSFNYDLLKWWEIDLGANYYYYKVEGTLYEAPFSRTSNNWNSRFNNTFTLHKNILLQVNSSYNSGSVTAQGTSSGFYQLDGALKISMLKRTLTATIQARNIVQTTKREYVSQGEGFYTYNLFQPKAPVVSLTLSYRFNNFKQSRKTNGGEGMGGEEGF